MAIGSATSNGSYLPLQADSDYTVTSSFGEDGTLTTTGMTGNRTSGLFTPKKDSGFSKDAFFKLLTKQLQYQDPSNPMDGSQMQAQLAQFAQLESTQNMQSSLEKMAEGYGSTLDVQKNTALSMTNSSSVSLIGRKVALLQSDVTLMSSGDKSSIKVHLGDAATGALEILDDKGKVVQTLDVGDKDALNNSTVEWDGRLASGELADSGKYKLHMVGSEKNPSLYCFAEDVVQGVRFSAEGPMLKVSGKEILANNILDVAVSDAATDGSNPLIDMKSPATLIGKTVRYGQSTVTLGSGIGASTDIKVSLGNRSSAQLQILDSEGTVIRTISVKDDADNPTGTVVAAWDGMDSVGENRLDAGSYRVRLVSADANAYTYQEGTVQGVGYTNGQVRVRVGGAELGLSSILDVGIGG